MTLTDTHLTLTRGERWSENTDPWTPDELVFVFWPMTKAYIVDKWIHLTHVNHMIGKDDLQLCADEALIKLAGSFHQWCDERDMDATSKPLFWHMLKQQIDWHVLRYRKRKAQILPSLQALDGGDSHPADPSLVRTEITRFAPPSMLHHDIVDYIATIPTRDKLLIAFRYFEELPLPEIEKLTGISRKALTEALTRITGKILTIAMNEVISDPIPVTKPRKQTPFEFPPDTHDWIARYYGCDLDTYLVYVTRHYYADVSYTIDFIERAYGIVHNYGNRVETREQM